MKIVTKKSIKRECWNLDYQLVKWLNEHLKVYLKTAGKHVDLTFHTFWIGNKKLTQEQCIRRLIEITDFLKDHNYDWTLDGANNLINLKDEMYDILQKIHFSLWW